MKTKKTILSKFWTSCKSKAMLASAAMVLSAAPLAAQYYVVEDFSTADAGYYGLYPKSIVATAITEYTANFGNEYSSYWPLNNNGGYSLVRAAEEGKADNALIPSGKNYMVFLGRGGSRGGIDLQVVS